MNNQAPESSQKTQTSRAGLKRLLLPVAIVVFSYWFPAAATAQPWWDTDWGQRVRLTFNNAAGGEDLVNFPVLVVLNSSRINYSLTQPNGEDIRFVDADGTTVLDHEIEVWDASGKSYIWVRIPQIDAGSSADYIMMYYDNPGAGDGQNPTGTWEVNYRGVWHLKENPSGAATIADSTFNSNHGVADNSMDGFDQVTGLIGPALDFDGLDDRVTIADSVSLDFDTSSFNYSAWVYVTANNGLGDSPWHKGGTAAAIPGYELALGTGTWDGVVSDGSILSAVPVSPSPLLDQWVHVTVVVDRGVNMLYGYLNGSNVGNLSISGLGSSSNGLDALIGGGPSAPFGGIIDEVRVAAGARSADWIAAQYQSAVDNFVTYGVPGAQMRVRTGSYVGDSSIDDRPITGIGFRPDMVIVKGDIALEAVVRTATMTGDTAKPAAGGAALTSNLIQSLDENGFTIGTDFHVNQTGTTYHWVAFEAAAGQLTVGSYGGNGTAGTSVAGVGFQPDLLILLPAINADPSFHSSTMAADQSYMLEGSAPLPDIIQTFEPDGFMVGDSVNANANGSTYHYAAWKGTAKRMTVGTYSGDGGDDHAIGGVGFSPELVIVQRDAGLSSVAKTESTGVATDQSFFFGPMANETDNIQALEPDGFQVGSLQRVNESSTLYHYMAFDAVDVNYRSIGAALDYSVGTVEATNGSSVVVGTGTAWMTNNRGRGDRIEIDGLQHVIEHVESDAVLHLTEGFGGVTGTGKSYTIARQYVALLEWEDCVDGGPCPFFSVASSSLVFDNRREIGIAYKDDVFTDSLEIEGSTTDTEHDIVLTADPGNRHPGVAWDGVSLPNHVVLDPGGVADGIRIIDEHVTVEWMEITGAGDGIRLSVPNTDNRIILRQNLIHDLVGDGIKVESGSPETALDAYNNIIYNGGGYGISVESNIAIPGRIQLLSNTVYGNSPAGGIFAAAASNAEILLRNNISYGQAPNDFAVTAPDPASSNNLSSDDTAPVSNAKLNVGSEVAFVSTGAYIDLHIQPTSVALNQGMDLEPEFDRDIDGEVRPQGLQWDIGADESSVLVAANYRSIGTQDPYGTVESDGNSTFVTTILGSRVVTGTGGTEWITYNRGRGDRINIDGVDYTIHWVESEARLHLTTPFTGTPGSGKQYTIARQFTNFTDWEDCIDGAGNGGTCWPFPEVTSDLIVDNRSEVGIAYQDSDFNTGVVIDGSTTDADHTIRLTADEANRHYGLSTQGAAIDLMGAGSTAVQISDEFVTFEWLRITGVGATNYGVDVTNLIGDNHIVLRNLLVHGIQGDGIRVNDAELVAQIYNNFVWGCDRGIVVTSSGSSAAIDILNNTVHGNMGGPNSGGILTSGPVLRPDRITLHNNISHSNLLPDYWFPSGAPDPASSHNLSSDDTAPGGFFQHNVDNGNGVISFVSASNLHIQSGSQAEGNGVDLSTDFNWDIDGLRRDTWDIGADEYFGVTAVDLLRFEATGYDGSVVLAWETGSETDNAGFYVYRSDAVTGPFERVSPSSVAGLGTSPVGALYRYVDSGLENGKTYYYEIEDFELSGRTERHGPVWAIPQAGAALPPELSEEPETSPRTSVVYGDPESVSFRELSRNSREVVLELLTGGFYAEPQGDGTVRLTVPGLVESGPTEGPQVPLKRSWVEAIAGRGVRLVSVEAEDVEVFRGLHPMEAGSSGIEVSRRGTVRAVRKRARRRFHASVRGMLPEHRAQVLSTGFQGDVKKAYVELAPLRYDARRGELQLSRRLVVRLAFAGRVAEERSLGGSRGRLAHRGSRSKKSVAVAARLGVVESGLYGVSFEELFGRQRRPIPKRWLRLSRQGEPVAFHVDGDAFGRGKKLYFVSEGAGLNPYGPEAVYELAVGVEGERMPVYAMEPTGALTLDTYWQDVEREENHRHGATLLEEANQWFWETILNGTSGSYPFEAQGMVPSVESGRLELRLRGASPEVEPEFVLRVYVNEVRLEELRWMGGESKRFEVAVPPGVVTEGTNTLRLEHATNEYSGVLLDGFTVTYPRASVTESGRLTGTWSGTGPASVSGTLGPVVDVTQVPAVWLGEVEKTETGVRFWAESGHRYEVGVLKPDVRRAGRMRLKRPQKGADYLLIGPREFLMEAEPLLALRRSQGLTTRSISLSDVWMEFGHGEVRPEAIREFLSYAYHEWTSPQVRYVVLLGDGTYDYKDYLGHGVPNVIPPLLARTSYLWTASDPSYGWVNGEDELPDIAIGRLPVETVEETRAVVAKLVAFGEGEGPMGPLVLVADDADHGGDFRASAEEIATGVLSGEQVRKIYLGELGVAATRDAIVNAFDSGARLMSYVGHGGTRLWADEQIFDAPAVETLLPQSHQPIVLTINCYTGSFHLPYPDYDSLSEELVKVEDRGAVAAISPSGLSLNTPAHYLHRAYLEELTSGRHDRLGDAIRAAQEAYAATGALPELLTIYHLFGDPAIKLR